MVLLGFFLKLSRRTLCDLVRNEESISPPFLGTAFCTKTPYQSLTANTDDLELLPPPSIFPQTTMGDHPSKAWVVLATPSTAATHSFHTDGGEEWFSLFSSMFVFLGFRVRQINRIIFCFNVEKLWLIWLCRAVSIESAFGVRGMYAINVSNKTTDYHRVTFRHLTLKCFLDLKKHSTAKFQ